MAIPTVVSSSSGRGLAVATLTVSHTVPAGSNRYLVVLCNVSSVFTSIGCAYGGISLTKISDVDCAAGSTGPGRLVAFGMANPTVGTANVVLSANTSGTLAASIISLAGCSAISTLTTAEGTGITPSVTLSSVAEGLVLDVCGTGGTDSVVYTSGAGQTSITTQNGLVGTNRRIATSSEPGAASVTMSWTIAPTGTWILGALTASGVVPPGPLMRVQTTPQVRSTSGPVTVTFTSPPTVGNAIVVVALLWNTGTLTCTDNKGHAYSQVVLRANGAAGGAGIFLCNRVVATGDPFSVTISSTTGTLFEASAIEVVGALMVDQTTSQAGTTGTFATTGPTPALTGANVFVASVVALFANQTSINVEVVSPSWTQELENYNYSATVAGEADSRTLVGVLGTTQDCDWVYSPSTSYIAVLAVFREEIPSLETRVTQETVEVLTQPTLPATQVTQVAIESLSQPVPIVRVTQHTVEVLGQTADNFGTDLSSASISQIATEVMFAPATTFARLSQTAVEVMFAPASVQPAKLSQVAVEVMVLPGPGVGGSQVTIWMGDSGGTIWIE